MAGLNPSEQITPTTLGDYRDVMSKAIFQNGISWRVVESKWAGTREVPRDCDPKTLVDLPPGEVDAMATDHPQPA
jgi:3-methyladenine DNA glycosylase Tag